MALVGPAAYKVRRGLTFPVRGMNVLFVTSNRIGDEAGRNGTSLEFYGSSFIADALGEKVAEADRETETVLTATFDLDEIVNMRTFWGIFRDRRPELYGPIATLDGRG